MEIRAGPRGDVDELMMETKKGRVWSPATQPLQDDGCLPCLQVMKRKTQKITYDV